MRSKLPLLAINRLFGCQLCTKNVGPTCCPYLISFSTPSSTTTATLPYTTAAWALAPTTTRAHSSNRSNTTSMTKWSSLAYTRSFLSSTRLPSLPMVKAWWWPSMGELSSLPLFWWCPDWSSGRLLLYNAILCHQTKGRECYPNKHRREWGSIWERDDMWTRIGVREGDERGMACCGPTW
jgi:hypothetical protein